MKIISYYPLDRITTLPQPILETILCLVPIKDAVRTSILSRSWRYNWTTISKLVFNEKEMFDLLDGNYYHWSRKSKIFPAIHQVLSMYQGPILEFSLTMKGDINLDDKMDQIIAYLSKNNTVKKFTLGFDRHPMYSLHSSFYSLPSSFYSLYRLTDIYLHNLDFYPKPTFKGGFPSLKNLHVYTGRPSGKSLGHLLSISPVLKSFTLMINPGVSCFRRDDSISMFEICKDLSLIEHMSLCMSAFQVYYEEPPPELPIALVHLKYLYLHSMQCIVRSLHSLVLLIRSSPNLEKIKLQVCECEAIGLATQLDYSHIWLEHLRELEIINCGDNKYQLEFVKFILSKSPVLKKVSIVFHNGVFVHSVEGIEAMRILLQSPCASPVAEINFEHPIYDLVGFKSLYTAI